MGACGKNHSRSLKHTRVQAHKLPVTNTSFAHFNTCNMKFNPFKHAYIHQRFYILVYRTARLLHKQTLDSFCQMTCYILYGHLHACTYAHTHTLASFLFSFWSCTGAWTGQSSLFKRGCFEFQRGAHERAAEYKGVPKDTLQRSM